MKPEWSYDIIAPFYDHDMGQSMPFDDLAGYLNLLPSAPADLLEIGCGTGRLTLALARCGFSVTAIDRSVPMLEQLQNKLLPEDNIDARVMDARNIRLCGPFDTILFAYSGFQYLLHDSDINLFCDAVQRVLAPSGTLILDIFLHHKCSETTGFIQDFERKLSDGRVLRRWKRISVTGDQNCVERKYILTGTADPLEYRTTSRQRLYSPRTLTAEMKKYGFMLDTGIFDYQIHPRRAKASHQFCV